MVRLLRKLVRSNRPQRYNSIVKPALLKWEEHCYFKSSHNINFHASRHHLVPIQHFRFAGSLYQKMQMGLREKSYFNGSLDHRLLWELLRTMEARNASFLYRNSRPLTSFEDLEETGNAFGL